MTEPSGASRLRTATRLAPVYGSVFLFMAAEGALHVLVPPYLSLELGLAPAAIGAVVGVFGAASLAARLPVGAAYSVARSRRLLLVGGGLSALSFALLPFASGLVAVAGLMALDGFGWSIATTTQLALLVAAKPARMTTAAAMGWYAGFTGLGNTAAGVAGGGLADAAGFRPTFVALAAAVALGTVMMVRAVPQRSANAIAAGHGTTESFSLRAARRAFRAMPVAVWSGVLVLFFINVVNSVVNTFQPVLVLAAGLSLTQIGVLSSCRSWASSTVRLGSGPLFGRIGTRGLTQPLVVVSATALFLIPVLRDDFVAQIPLFLAMGLARGLLRVTATADAFDSTGDRERQHGLTAAVLHAGLDCGRIAGPVLGGVVAQLVGIATMFEVLAVLLVAVYVALELAARRSARAAVS